MKILRSLPLVSRICRRAASPVVLVPTMGALHAGHLALIRRARAVAGKTGTVAVTIFVNPTQFGPREDLAKYPRPIDEDIRLCREVRVDLLILPAVADIYPRDFSTFIEESELSKALCGASRPGHFRGVCTVVAKLLHLTGADAAVFGEKDFQQLAIIRRMVRDLNLPVKIIAVPTVREADGLALSSRNRYLTEAERAQAPTLRAALSVAASSAKKEPAALRRIAIQHLKKAPLARIDYLEVVDAETLQPATKNTAPKLIAAAVIFGATRLIDNILVP